MLGLGLGLGIEDRIDQPEAQASGLEVRSFEDGGVVEAREALVDRIRALGRFYYDASIVYLPHAYSEGKMYCIKPNNGDADLTMTHAGTNSTRVNPDGLVQDSPKNLLRYSEQFDNAAWTTFNQTVSPNASIAPDGTTTADKIVKNNGVSTTSITRQTGASSVTGNYTASVFAKNSGWNFLYLSVKSTSYNGVSVNLTDGTVTEIGANIVNTSVVQLANGYFHISVTMTLTAENATISLQPRDSATVITIGDGVNGVLVWGAQLEQGSEPTDYLRTTDRQDFGRLDYLLSAYPVHKIEPARTNLLRYSEQFDNAAWTKDNSTISANATTAPDGTTTADKLIEDATANFHRVRQQPTLVAGTYVQSVYAKQAERRYLVLRNELTGVNLNACFDLQEGTILYDGFSGDAFIEEVANGFYRCGVIETDAAGATRTISILLSDAPVLDNIIPSYTGDGTSGIYIWGNQLEAGSYPTSYIPTEASTVTRSAETLLKTGLASYLGDSEGTLFFEASSVEEVKSYLISLSDNSTANRVMLGVASSKFYTQVRVSSVVQADLIGGSYTYGDSFKIAVSYEANRFVLYANGVKIGEDLSGSTFGAAILTHLRLDNGGGSSIFYGNVKAVLCIPFALSDEQCIELTSYYTYDYMAGELGYTID